MGHYSRIVDMAGTGVGEMTTHRISDFYRTHTACGLPVADWLWDPWEYAHTHTPDLFHRTDPARKGHTLCGLTYRVLLGNPAAWPVLAHCPACVATPVPDPPADGYLLEFARWCRLPDGRRIDVVSICHTADTIPAVWEELPSDDWPLRDVLQVVAALGWHLDTEPVYDPRYGVTRARVTPSAPVQSAMF